MLTAVIVSSLLPSLAIAQKRAIAETDLFAFQWVGDTQLSPDGKTIAFVQASVAPSHADTRSRTT
jgi:hypothetical protein